MKIRVYGSQDVETCEWAERMSGELQKRVTQRETTQIGYFGEESWDNQRVVGEQAEAFITRNTMLSLEKRAGILFLPSQLPKIVFTCFVPFVPSASSEPFSTRCSVSSMPYSVLEEREDKSKGL